MAVSPNADLGRIALVCGVRPHGRNAILECTRQLDDALHGAGVDSQVLESANRRLPALDGSDIVLLAYNPYLYGRHGITPQLVSSWLAARQAHADVTFALMVHELYDPIDSWRGALTGPPQRMQLRALHAACDALFVSTEPWAARIANWRPRRAVQHLPVGSNLPSSDADRNVVRSELGIGSATPVLASFATAHPSRLFDHIVLAAGAVAQETGEAVLLHLGAGAPPLPGLRSEVRLIAPGELDAAAVARLLRGADVFLAPFSDGASTRRGSLMAALQAGLPVVATGGPATGRLLREASAIELVDGDATDFARAVTALVRDLPRRGTMAQAARPFYDSHFAWPQIAAELCRGLLTARSGRR